MIGQQTIETVSYYVYLGFKLSSRGIWTKAQEQLAEQASKAMHALMINLRKLGRVPIPLCFKIFDTKILPILHYGSEIWGYHEGQAIENVHIKFCKFLLSSQKSYIHAGA